MAQVENIVTQTDFSGGQVDVTIKRNDPHPLHKAGLRQCINWRILNAQGLTNRAGRSAQFLDGPRVDEVIMAPGFPFLLCFSAGIITIRSLNGAVVFTSNTRPWTAANVGLIVWAMYQYQIFITFPGMQPLVITWTPNTTTFAIANYAPAINLGGQKRTFFYRLSPLGVTLLPSAYTGSVTLTFSAGMNLTAGQVGTLIRYDGRQIRIDSVTDATHATGTVMETLPRTQILVFGRDPRTVFQIGDVVIGTQTGAKAVVTSFVTGLDEMKVLTLNGIFFTDGTSPNNEYCVGPSGSLPVSSVDVANVPDATTVWDDEVMNSFRGWPASCFSDQNRLGFCNFPDLPSAIGWSAIGLVTDLYVPTNAITAANAIFELVPRWNQVFYVVPGPESDEFVFCDNATYAIPISQQNPLAPGSVAFNRIDEGSARIQPRFYRGAIIYTNAGANMIRAIAATGSLTRPYEARSLTDFHQKLFNNVAAIAAPDGDDLLFPERYIYVLNGDGTAVACKVAVENGQIKDVPGWTLHVAGGGGAIKWISARIGHVWFTVSYPGASGPMAELLDASQYLDAAITVNSPPAQLAPPGGKGPLWWAPGQPVYLFDNGLRQLGVYQTDANGFIIPQFIGGENLTSPALGMGFPWVSTAEPFIPSPPGGQDVHQRMLRRQVSQMCVYFIDSSGFLFQKLYAEPLRPGGPALGSPMNNRRVPSYNQGDDPMQPVPLREGAEFWRPSGSDYDPRNAIIKDVPGPMTILEIAQEVTV
jgi:hypothetical protein